MALQYGKGQRSVYTSMSSPEGDYTECPPQAKCCLKVLGCANVMSGLVVYLLPFQEKSLLAELVSTQSSVPAS